MTNDCGKSDNFVVPAKPPNKGANRRKRRKGPAEVVEERRLAKGNSREQNTRRTQGRLRVQNALSRIRGAAKRDRGIRFTALLHHVYSTDTLREAYYGLDRDAAPGVDGVTWQDYGENLEENIRDLSERLKRGGYRARPVRRKYIPKPDGRQRPIGVTTLEDKLVQAATTMVLNAIYEEDFIGISYGFRPRRSQHDALDALWVGLHRKVNWVLDADVQGFFDTISHAHLIEFIERRIADRRVIRLIQKWLKAGVLEEGRRVRVEEGTPQGGTVSPLLANIYLHYVLDRWAQDWRRRRRGTEVIIVRYADDFVVGFQHREVAERFLEELRERFAQYNLVLHPDKTRLIEFGRFADENRRRRGRKRPETFDFLGFTHYCGKTSKGKFHVKRRTKKQRLRAKLKELGQELMRRRHLPVPVVGKWLRSVIEGHIRYFGVPSNYQCLASFVRQVTRLWRKALSRRSQKGYVTWERMKRLRARWFPKVRIVHPFPNQRLCV
jgi:RNA-directed DNA polymerase